jgi:tripartite-type tricarboxylate transporter receptor subunit TctC
VASLSRAVPTYLKREKQAMTRNRRGAALGAVSFTVAALFMPASGRAQLYPERAIQLQVPFQAGGAVDSTARIVANQLAINLGQPVVVENRVGGGGTIGTNLVAKAPPDGYNLLFIASGPMVLAPGLYGKVPYDPVSDFTPVALVASYPNTLLINRKSSFKSVADIIAAARAKPGSMSYASGGVGTILHLSGELFKKTAEIQLVHIPYKGGLAAIPDLLASRLDMLFANIGLGLPYVSSDELAVIAITSTERSPLLPNTPTLAAAGGLPGYETSDWFGILAPAATPKLIIDRLHKEISAILQMPEIKSKLLSQGAQLANKTPAEFGNFIRAELVKWTDMIKTIGVKAD